VGKMRRQRLSVWFPEEPPKNHPAAGAGGLSAAGRHHEWKVVGHNLFKENCYEKGVGSLSDVIAGVIVQRRKTKYRQ
jgi:hypothetical protein